LGFSAGGAGRNRIMLAAIAAIMVVIGSFITTFAALIFGTSY
jgi:hypothetical protein